MKKAGEKVLVNAEDGFFHLSQYEVTCRPQILSPILPLRGGDIKMYNTSSNKTINILTIFWFVIHAGVSLQSLV